MLDKKTLCSLIPHAEKMCLLEKVISWDEKNISCQADSHLDKNNPLRNDQQLPVSALIEYGAQAMAVHGSLLAREKNEKMQEGYLAALREVTFNNLDVNEFDVSMLQGVLDVSATQMMASGGNMIYQFNILHNGTELVSGRATVVAVLN